MFIPPRGCPCPCHPMFIPPRGGPCPCHPVFIPPRGRPCPCHPMFIPPRGGPCPCHPVFIPPRGRRYALGWTCAEAERDMHAYCPHDVIRDRAIAGVNEDGGFDTGVILHADGTMTILYDASLPLRETGLIE